MTSTIKKYLWSTKDSKLNRFWMTRESVNYFRWIIPLTTLLCWASLLREHRWNSVWTDLWFTRDMVCVFVYVWRVTWRPMAACLAVSLIQCCNGGTDGAAESRLQQRSSTDRGAPHSHLTTTLRSAWGTRPRSTVCLSVNHSPWLLVFLVSVKAPIHTKIMNFFIIR